MDYRQTVIGLLTMILTGVLLILKTIISNPNTNLTKKQELATEKFFDESKKLVEGLPDSIT